MPEMLESFLKFATFGVTCEIIFTASAEVYYAIKEKRKIDYSLKGFSYVWMIPIYGSIAFLAPLVIEPLSSLPLLVRLLIYTLIIFTVEYITGWIIKAITGRCPWHYETGRHVHHLINLDYTPAWMGFAAIVEYLHYNY